MRRHDLIPGDAGAATGNDGSAQFRLSNARTFALIGMVAIVLPTLLAIARNHWSSQEGSQGPIVLATGIWLFWRARDTLYREAAPLTGMAWAYAIVPLMAIYAFARVYRILPLESAITYLIGILIAVLYLGPALVRRFWFPFVYLAFLIVPPSILVSELTQPLRIWISAVVVDALHALGYPVAASGAIIQIGPYELLVRYACAGIGSLLTLCAVGLFYVHLRRDAGARFGSALLVAIVPVAVVANLVRVAIVILLTWYFGAVIGEGVAHEAAGLLMFGIAMLGMFAIDGALSALSGSRGHRHA